MNRRGFLGTMVALAGSTVVAKHDWLVSTAEARPDATIESLPDPVVSRDARMVALRRAILFNRGELPVVWTLARGETLLLSAHVSALGGMVVWMPNPGEEVILPLRDLQKGSLPKVTVDLLYEDLTTGELWAQHDGPGSGSVHHSVTWTAK